jgi:tetratricopeptide (TPR) repeat protein
MRRSAAMLAACMIIVCACTDKRSKSARYLRVGNASREHGSYTEALGLYEKGIHSDPSNGELYWRAGETASALKQWDRAIWFLQRAMSLQPNRIESYSEAAGIYIMVYGTVPRPQQTAILRELRTISEDLHQRFPNTFDDLRIAGYVNLLSERPERALALFQRARQKKPGDQETLARCIELLVASGQVDKAEALVTEADPRDARAPEVYQALARHYLAANRFADVERIARTEVKNSPNLSSGYLLLAASQYSEQRLPDMLDSVGRVAALGPLGPYEAGDFYLRIGDLPRARQMYESGAARSSKLQAAYQKRLVEVLAKQGQLADGELVVRTLLNADPTDQEALAIQASLSLMKGNARAAVGQFESVARNLPEDYVLRYLYGHALLVTGNVDEAVTQFGESLRLRGDYIWPRIALAHITADSGKYGDTLLLGSELAQNDLLNVPFDTAGQRPQERPFYETVLKVPANGGLPLSHLAVKMADAGIGVENAVIIAERVQRAMPSNDEVAADLAAVYTRVNRLDAAMNLMRPIVERNPDRRMFRYRLAAILLDKGNRTQAREECEAALRAQGSDEEKTQVMQLLRKIG